MHLSGLILLSTACIVIWIVAFLLSNLSNEIIAANAVVVIDEKPSLLSYLSVTNCCDKIPGPS